MPTDEQPPLATTPSVPFWALQMVSDIASIKATVAVIPKIDREMDEIRSTSVPMREHEVLIKRTDELWSSYQQMRGGLRVFVFFQAATNLAAVVWAALRQTGHI